MRRSYGDGLRILSINIQWHLANWITQGRLHFENEFALPLDMTRELMILDEMLSDRQLIFFCPTFRNKQEGGYYRFSREEKAQLNKFLVENNLVLGVRQHMADTANSYMNNLAGLPVLDLGNQNFTNIEMIYRKADMLITYRK
jgi:hypothetical protein